MVNLTKMNKIKFKFHKDDKGKIQLNDYGEFRMGLTDEEIKDYIRVRANKYRIETLYKKFIEISCCNTMTSCYCDNCRRCLILMYRWDVERFADILFGLSSSTYLD